MHFLYCQGNVLCPRVHAVLTRTECCAHVVLSSRRCCGHDVLTGERAVLRRC